MSGLTASWHDRLRLWIFGGPDRPAGLIPWEPPTGGGWMRAWDGLTKTVDMAPVVQALVDAGQDALALEVASVIQQAREALLVAFPQMSVEEIGGDIRPPPSDDEAADWMVRVQVIDSQERFIQELEMGTVELAQVEIFRTLYPETFKILHQTIAAMTNEANVRRIQVPWEVQDTIRRAAMLPEKQQPAADKPPVETPQPERKGKFDAADALTSAQKQDAGTAVL